METQVQKQSVKAASDLTVAIVARAGATDDELKDFLAATADTEDSYLIEMRTRALRLQVVNRALNDTGMPEERWKLVTWFTEQKPRLDTALGSA